jgi:hypothetical protein
MAPLIGEDGISLAWVASFIVAVVLVLELVIPESIIGLVPLLGALVGAISDATALAFALTVAVLILLGWIISARFISERSADSAEGVARRVERRFEAFVTEWFSVGRFVLSGLLIVGVAFMSELGTFAGDIAGLLGQAPLVVTQSATAIVGWLALGGELPVIGPLMAGLTPPQWALVSLFLLVVGVSWRNA